MSRPFHFKGTPMAKHTILDLIDRSNIVDGHKEFPFRSHLGGSMIGNNCERAIWYGFRWTLRPSHPARILRLFGRGHREEFQFVKHLRAAGIEVQEFAQRLVWEPASNTYLATEWDDLSFDSAQWDDVTGDEAHMKMAELQGVKLKQWRISDVDGHFGGSLDGIAKAPFPVAACEWVGGQMQLLEEAIEIGEPFLLEFKTHNTKSFVALVTKGVKEYKPVHYMQMQVYMHKKDLNYALYMAVNKNDDDLHIEIVRRDPVIGAALIAKAARVVAAKQPPLRIGKHASWVDCQWCDYKGPCHKNEPVDRNCRTCANVEPIEDGKWRCNHWQAVIPNLDAMLIGCDNHKTITD